MGFENPMMTSIELFPWKLLDSIVGSSLQYASTVIGNDLAAEGRI